LRTPQVPRSVIKHHVPLTSSFLVFRLNCLHQDAKSRLEGGELEPVGSGEVAGSGTGSTPGCDLPVTMVNRDREKRDRVEEL
jgi:hypothetical protein